VDELIERIGVDASRAFVHELELAGLTRKRGAWLELA
jgi:hypothetical protein